MRLGFIILFYTKPLEIHYLAVFVVNRVKLLLFIVESRKFVDSSWSGIIPPARVIHIHLRPILILAS